MGASEEGQWAMNELDDIDRVDTQVAFARLIDATPPVVSQLISRGIISKGQTLREWLSAYLRHLRANAQGRGEDGEEPSELTRARIREANAKAHKAEVETARELGYLVLESDVKRSLSNWAARGSLALNAAERRISEGLRSEFGMVLESRHVSDHIRDAQRSIAAYAHELSALTAAGRLGVGAAGADPDDAVCGDQALPGPGDQ
jgi:phage terminase Nu1 subunit (DNA packaging protein)